MSDTIRDDENRIGARVISSQARSSDKKITNDELIEIDEEESRERRPVDLIASETYFFMIFFSWRNVWNFFSYRYKRASKRRGEHMLVDGQTRDGRERTISG